MPQGTGILLSWFFSHLVGSCNPPCKKLCNSSAVTPVLSIAWIALLGAVVFTTFKGLMSKVKVITRGEATRLINKEDAVVVDLRQRDDFRKGHIAGAINLLPSDIKANNVGELEKHKSQPIIVVDGSGMQAQEPASALNKAGFEKVFVLKEGIAGWSGENLPLVRGK
ncbi:Rhodanese-related sulfurtransferase [Klebsiella pneumoniae]|uniref:Rhodanese-related sulfurtransferase n=9 Tax=Enterobacterales TaxID=91347 RepID=A0A378FW16_KLEPN|nr:Rhodanese-related sulfurtransferase [Klebsiella pneumoniae]